MSDLLCCEWMQDVGSSENSEIDKFFQTKKNFQEPSFNLMINIIYFYVKCYRYEI